jgi:hypothetical protein
MADSESDDENQPEPKRRNAFIRYLGTADAWTALATIFLVIVGIWGVTETRHALELSERAWLSPVGGQITKMPEKTKGIHFAVNFSNSGREPATDLNFRAQNSTIDAYEGEFTDMINIKVPENTACFNLEPARKRAVIAPNITFGFTYDSLRGEPAFIADDAIINGSKFLVINGCVAYRSLEKTHHTSFCYVVESSNATPQNQNVTIVLNAGQAPVSVPVISPAPSPGGGGRNYLLAPCAAGFDATSIAAKIQNPSKITPAHRSSLQG